MSESSYPQRVAIAGATGYIGGRLAPRLLGSGYSIRCLVRTPAKLQGREWVEDSRVEVRQADLADAESLARNLEGCQAAFYLVHSMGFALENFSTDGSFRTKDGGDGGVPIDASVELYDGQPVNGPSGLRQALMRYSPQFVRVVTEKLMTYGLGRGVEYYDMPVIRSIVRDAGKNNYRFSSIVLGIVKSAPFQMRVKTEENAN